jgi:hypothetical protein
MQNKLKMSENKIFIKMELSFHHFDEVECRTSSEPLNLGGIVGMIDLDLL